MHGTGDGLRNGKAHGRKIPHTALMWLLAYCRFTGLVDTATAAPTASSVGPAVTFLGMADTAGCIPSPGTPGCVCQGPTPTPIYENGTRVFTAPSSGIFMLVVEGKPQSPTDPPVGISVDRTAPRREAGPPVGGVAGAR